MENEGFEFLCPTGEFDCPYYKDGICTIGPKPWEECDEAAYYYDPIEDEEDE